MATLNDAAACLKAFYRLVGVKSNDASLVEQGESANDVAYLCLNHGIEAAQRFVLSSGGSERWEKRSSAIVWSGADATDGGRYWALPSDFLRLGGGPRLSPLVQANGERWGTEITSDDKDRTGNAFYLRGERLWLARNAAPPTTLYLEYIYKHPEFTSSVTLDFDAPARALAIAYAAQHAMGEAWYTGEPDRQAAILRNVELWERETRKVTRRTRQPRRMTAPKLYGRHWV